jgi:putative ABC transport system ATP-binding protein
MNSTKTPEERPAYKTMTDIIKVDHLKREFIVGDQKVQALRGISFTVKQGEFVTIMGTSGSGKSTLLNILGCLDTPTEGEYLLDGISVRTMSKNERAKLRNMKIGFVFQTYNLLPRTTALENVELPLMYNSAVSAKERREKAMHVLEAVGLADRMHHMPNQMSGGQQQRVAIARALVNDPVIILADEATGNLDTRTSYEIMSLFQKLNSEGKTIAFVTHEPDIALFSQRSIMLRDGRITRDEKREKIGSAVESLAALPVEVELD